MELRVNFNFLISKWQPGRDGANNGRSVLCSHPTSEVGQHPGPAGKQAGMPLPRIPLGIPAPLLPKDTFLSFLREWFGACSELAEIVAKNYFGVLFLVLGFE